MRALIFLILVAAVVAVGTQTVFTVDETQLAIVTRFGEPVRDPIQNPGLNFKTPFVEAVIYLDKRLLLFDAPPSSLLTKDKKKPPYRRLRQGPDRRSAALRADRCDGAGGSEPSH